MDTLTNGTDYLGAERFSAIGPEPFMLIELDDSAALHTAYRLRERTQAILIGLHRRSALQPETIAAFDVILSADPGAPHPCVRRNADKLDDSARQLVSAIRRTPVAANVLCHVLRLSEMLDLRDAIGAESLGYSTLLAGAEFRHWRNSREHVPVQADGSDDHPPLRIDRDNDLVTITLDHPASRNAMSAPMRDALFEALAAVADDPSRPRVKLKASGACFSTGGALEEFGTADDLALAHIVRTTRSAAILLHELGDRASAELHGACIGSGIEVPMAAARRTARPGTFIQLPELAMGLIPGAGGTATLSRAIGRHRTAFLALSGRRVHVSALADWGIAAVGGEA